MKFFNLMLLLFILVAIAVGSGISNNISREELNALDERIDNYNMSQVALHPEDFNNTYAVGVVTVLEYYVKFAVAAGLQVMKLGIHFGHENPEHVSPNFIIKVLYIIVIAILITLLIKPVSYLVILIILFGVWIKQGIENITRRKRKSIEKDSLISEK